MKVLVINDVSGRLDHVQAVLQATAGQHIKAVVILGDLVATAAREHVAVLEAAVGDVPQTLANAVEDEIAAEDSTYAGVFALLGARNMPMYVIPGAHDNLRVLDAARAHYQGRAAIMSVHGTAAALGAETVVAGLGGAIAPADGAWTMLEYPAEEVNADFEHMVRARPTLWSRPHRVFAVATSPFGGSIRPQAQPTDGAPAVAAVIQRYQPAWVFYGGPGSRQRSTQQGGTRLVNPGALQHGEYAVIDLELGNVHLLRLGATEVSPHPTIGAIDATPLSQRTRTRSARPAAR